MSTHALATTIETLRAMLEAQTLRAAELRRSLDELPTVEASIETLRAAIDLLDGDDAPAQTDAPKTLSEAIESVVDSIDGVFDINSVQDALRATFPGLLPGGYINPTTVSGTLRRMTDRGRLELVEPGRGKRAARYRRVRLGVVPEFDLGIRLEQQPLMPMN